MFKFIHEDRQTHMDVVIDNLLTEMESTDPKSQEYKNLASNLKTTCEAKSFVEKDRRPSADAIVAGIVSLGGILTILTYEKTEILTSKAVMYLLKPIMKQK